MSVRGLRIHTPKDYYIILNPTLHIFMVIKLIIFSLQSSLTKFHCNFYSSYRTLGKDIMKSRQKYKKLSYLGMQIFVMKQLPSHKLQIKLHNCMSNLLTKC